MASGSSKSFTPPQGGSPIDRQGRQAQQQPGRLPQISGSLPETSGKVGKLGKLARARQDACLGHGGKLPACLPENQGKMLA